MSGVDAPSRRKRAISLDELSRLAGEAWAREDAKRRAIVQDVREPARARRHGSPLAGGGRKGSRRSESMEGLRW